MKNTVRFLSLLVVLVLCMSLVPVSAFASEEPEEIVSGGEALIPMVNTESTVEEASEKVTGEEIIHWDGTTSGSCGDNLTWTLDDRGTLTISGTGEMDRWDPPDFSPWKGNRESVRNIIIAEGVTSIGRFAFYNCSNLESVTIPKSITSIDQGAFSECGNIESVYYLGTMVFWFEISFGEGGGSNPGECANHLYIDGDEIAGNLDIPIGVTCIPDYAFQGRSLLTSVTIPSGVTEIGGAAFAGCSNLQSVSIPNSVTYIGYSAFSECVSLKSITVPESVTYLSSCMLANCENLTAVSLPKTITSIEANTFFGCNSLTDIYYAGTQTQWSNIILYSEGNLYESVQIHYDCQSGDANGDGSISARDLVMFAKYISGGTEYINAQNLDVNGDRDINLLDLVHLMKLLAGIM